MLLPLLLLLFEKPSAFCRRRLTPWNRVFQLLQRPLKMCTNRRPFKLYTRQSILNFRNGCSAGRLGPLGTGRLVDITARIRDPCRHLCKWTSTCVSSVEDARQWRSLGAASLFSSVMFSRATRCCQQIMQHDVRPVRLTLNHLGRLVAGPGAVPVLLVQSIHHTISKKTDYCLTRYSLKTISSQTTQNTTRPLHLKQEGPAITVNISWLLLRKVQRCNHKSCSPETGPGQCPCRRPTDRC